MAIVELTLENGETKRIDFGDYTPTQADMEEVSTSFKVSKPKPTPTPQPKPQPKPTPAPKPIPKVQTQAYQTPADSDPISAQYDVIANDPTLSKEQKIAKMNELKTSIDKDINKQKNKRLAQLYGGAALEIGSMLIPFGGAAKAGATIATKLAKPAFREVAKRVAARELGAGVGSGLASSAVYGLGSGISQGKDAKGIAKEVGLNILTGGLVGGAVGAAGAKVATNVGKTGQRIKNIQAKQKTPLVDRMSDEALERLTAPASQYGVPKIDSAKNAAIAKQIQDNINVQEQLMSEYRTLHSDMNKKYGSIDNLKKQAVADMPQNAQYGTRSEAIDDYRNLLAYEQELQNANYVNNNIKSSVTREIVNPNPLQVKSKQTQPKVNQTPVVEQVVEKLPQQAVEQIPEGMKLRGAVTTIENKFGKDVADQITDRTYDVRGKAVNKAEFEALAPEQQSQLINNADDLSDLATYAKAEYIKNRLANGEVPTSMLNNWVKGGTEKAQALQAQKWLAPDTVEGAMVKAQSVIREAQPKQVKKLLDSADDIVKKSKGKTRKQVDDLLKVKETRSLRRKNIVDGIMELDKKGQLTSENLTKLINKKYKVPEITDDDIKEFERLTTNIKNATTEREKNIAEALLNKHIVDKVPVGFADKDQTYRTINMLLSPQSRSKDILGTTLYQGERFLDEAFAKIPAAISRVRGFKTRTLGFQNKAWREGLKRGWQEVNEDIKLGINTGRSGEGARYDLTSRPSFEGTPVLGASEKLLNRVIRGVDRPLYEAAYNASIADQLAVQGLKEPTKEIIEQAIKEARQAVFQGDSIAAKLGLGIRNVLNAKGTPLEKLRLGQRNIPFLQTVSNITTEGLKASPAGLPYSLIKYARAKTVPELREAELEIGKALKGAALYGTGGYALAQMTPEQTNIGQLGGTNYMGDDVTGLPQQGIAIGDKAISLASMPQVGIPLTMWKSVFEKGTPSQKIANMLMQGSNVLMDLPAFKGVGDIVKSGADINKAIGEVEQTGDYSGVKEAANKALQQYAANQLSQYIPFGGFLGNIRNAVDPYRRELYTDDTLEYLGNRIVNRIPLASSTLPIKYNVIGEPSMMNNIENPLARTASALIDPLSFRNYTPRPQSMTDLDALRQYAMENDITGKTTLKYEKAKRKIGTKKSGQVKLTNEQYSEYQRILGTNMKGNLEALMQTERYKKASEKAKIKMVRDVRKRVKEDAEAKIKNAIRETML